MVRVLTKRILLKGEIKLFDEVSSISFSINEGFKEVRHMLIWAPPTIKLLKLWRLITGRNFQTINPLSVWSCICQGGIFGNFVLVFDGPHDELFDLINRNRSSEETLISLSSSTCFEGR